MINTNILEVKNLSKKYKNFVALDNVSFEIKKGSFHAFIGTNGSGKTTTIKCIIGAYQKYTGDILINNISVTNPFSRSNLGYIPENATFPKDVTVYDYLSFLGSLFKLTKNEIEQKINFYLQQFKITDLKNKKPFNFSSGQKKKVLLIQALLADPEIIILDEPAANLDPYGRYELFNILKTLQSQGKTILICSHILSEVDNYSDSLTLINDGKIIYNGNKYDSLENIFYEKVIASK